MTACSVSSSPSDIQYEWDRSRTCTALSELPTGAKRWREFSKDGQGVLAIGLFSAFNPLHSQIVKSQTLSLNASFLS